ncbi:hypothetical protein [Phenylobacterium sp. J367]|uniref:hypothetical protein n=1 Tax=Phenylobacterium sp. J367 TaxID=2898435 RepID=UPI0021513A10|nr:hypothetical protein [Phenylobacterium sp. J367]MCR5876974.1 hypothetical protein [Phenylobacterium sp. J367]MCR5877042.1 hypothetical protein [Phenylobacterium sp. J367]
MNIAEKHELECLRARVAQLDYPCSPHCEGYLRELSSRNVAGFLSEPDDAWAERFCAYVNWSPDGQNVSFNADGPLAISFRQMAKNYIKAAQEAWVSTRVEAAAPPAEGSASSPSEASAGNFAQDELKASPND